MADPRERLIVALDCSSAAAAQKIVAAVGESALHYKVGKQLFVAEGPALVRDLQASGRRVFLDLKFHDIPNTVAAAVTEAVRLGVSMVTVHATGGSRMLEAAAEAASGSTTQVLAVTVLTSLDDRDMEVIGVRGSVTDQALRLGTLAIRHGCHGLVASAREASLLRQELGRDFLLVTPGVRPSGSPVGDQVRVVTPGEAMAAGASHIVVGRPITGAADPALEARAILAEMGN